MLTVVLVRKAFTCCLIHLYTVDCLPVPVTSYKKKTVASIVVSEECRVLILPGCRVSQSPRDGAK